jgi:hypothetical protein
MELIHDYRLVFGEQSADNGTYFITCVGAYMGAETNQQHLPKRRKKLQYSDRLA